mgnify:CR=1 FL=1
MILARLFETLFGEGITVIATSNRKPDDLYKDGLQRDRFQPFIDLIKQRLEILELGGEHDYRLDRLRSFDVYLTPSRRLGQRQARRSLSRAERRRRWRAARAAHPGPRRRHPARRARRRHGALSRLVRQADGREPISSASPSISTRSSWPTFPGWTPDSQDKAARFVTMIDTFYEKKVKFICSAATAPTGLYVEGDGAFEFQRTVSR